MELPTTFTIPRTLAPLAFDSLRAASESAVSPDWLMITTRVPSSMMGSRYLYSEARSTSTGILAIPSNTYLLVIPAWYAEPQATIMILSIFCISSSVIFSSSITISQPLMRGEKVSVIAFGCSYISFSIKCSYPPFSAASTSHSIWVDSFSIGSSSTLKNSMESAVILTISSFSIK